MASRRKPADHPKRCQCFSCREGIGLHISKHPQKSCRCGTCFNRRLDLWKLEIADKKVASSEATHQAPTLEKPVFVKAHWRKSKNWKRSDPQFREWLKKRGNK